MSIKSHCQRFASWLTLVYIVIVVRFVRSGSDSVKFRCEL